MIRRLAAALRDGLVELCFPARCAACGTRVPEGAALCGGCGVSLEAVGAAGCPVCGLPGAEAGTGAGAARCGRCAAVPPAFARARAPFLYGGELATAIGRFKFGGHPELGGPLGSLLAPALAATLADFAAAPLFVPVPLHPRRLRRREFNQSLLLGRAARAALRAAGHRAVPAPDPFALRRVRDTRPQVDLGAGERAANVAGAFVAAPRRVAGRAVLLLDDVLTTGATAGECARALHAAGAGRIEVLTLARALP